MVHHYKLSLRNHNKKRVKNKSHMNISVNDKKAFHKIQQPCRINTHETVNNIESI